MRPQFYIDVVGWHCSACDYWTLTKNGQVRHWYRTHGRQAQTAT